MWRYLGALVFFLTLASVVIVSQLGRGYDRRLW